MDSTTTMQQLLDNLAADLSKNFGEMRHQLVNLDKRLHAIERARIHGDAAITSVQAKLDREAAINDLAAETKRVMIATGKSYLKCKLDEPQSSSAPEIILAVSDTLLSDAPPSPQPPMGLLFPPLKGPPIIQSVTVQDPDNHQRELPLRTPPTATPPTTPSPPPAVQHSSATNQQETPLAAHSSSQLLVSPAATPQAKAPP